MLTFAGSVDEWSRAIAEALATRDNVCARTARQGVASRHDWTTLANKVLSILQARLQPGVA